MSQGNKVASIPIAIPLGRNAVEKEQLEQVEIGAIYEHYKNKLYRVHGVFRNTETLELEVAYESLYEDTTGYGVLWIRPLSMFVGAVEVDDKIMLRFKKKNM